MEANSAFAEVKVLRGEMDIVKTTLSEIRGAGKFAETLNRFGPSLVMIICVVVFYLIGHKV